MSNDSKIDMQRMKILSILPPNVELAAKANAKLFTSNVEGKVWLYSDGQSLQFQMFLFLLPFPLRLSLPLPQQVNLPKKFQEKTN